MASEHFAVIDTMDNDTQDSGQLDLFRHSRAVTLTNDAIAALLARNSAHAEASVDRLRAEEPGYHTLDALSRLCRALGEWPPSTANVVEIARAIHQLEAEVQPSAAASMGGHAVDFMRPLWRDLAQAARAHEYDKAFPQSHCAALYLRCGDAKAAAGAAASVPNSDNNADALQWLAVSHYRMDGLDACRPILARLALVAPGRLKCTLAEIADVTLNQNWRAFETTCTWLDPDDENTGSWFPAWYLLEYQGARIVPVELITLPATRPAQALITIARLLELEKRGHSAVLISARSRLRELGSDIFALYMARRTVNHR